ncbi:MAG TPA: glycosyltransferase [Pseudomonadales bacterium]|nr:glycosyltransferase [Pseudomonadales bacterium]
MNKPIPALIVPTLNGHDRINDLFASIDYPVDHAVIINNDANRAVTASSNQVARLSVINMPANLGVAASWNLGIKVTPFAQYWFVVNDDVTFPPNAMERFAWYAENYGTIAVADAVSPWCAFTLSEDVVNAVGLFDEAFYPAYFEDTDYARRAREYMGEDVIYNTDVKVNHANSSTIGGGYGEANQRTYQSNYKTFEAKLSLNQYDPFGWQLTVRRANDWGV